jgi:hypothetical protein
MKITHGKKKSWTCEAPPTNQYKYTILFLFAIHILVHGRAHFFVFERAILMGPLANFLEHGAPRKRSTSLQPQWKN